MKSKVIVSLLLAVLMIGAVVTPVLADRAAGNLEALASEPGTGKYSIRTTHDNRLKVTVSLKGATADSTYEVHVYCGAYYEQAGTFMTDSKGNGRFSRFAVTDYPSNLSPKVFDAGSYTFEIFVKRLGPIVFISEHPDGLTFK